MVTCYIALGSNLGKRRKNINLALKYLRQDPAIKMLKVSSIIETKPVGGPPQPKFLNAVAKLQTAYSAQELLKKLQEIEIKIGRKTPHPKNNPRTIDLDILTFGDLKIDSPDLKIPHPEMWQREFVTKPLREIAPELFEFEPTPHQPFNRIPNGEGWRRGSAPSERSKRKHGQYKFLLL